MSLYCQKILGVYITSSQKKIILEDIRKYLVHGSQFIDKQRRNSIKPLVIVTPNPEQIVYAQKDSHFMDILNRADVALPDGIGVVWASGLVHSKQKAENSQMIKERIPGVEFMENLVRLAAQRGDRIGLIGGRAGLAVRSFECLRQKNTKLDGWAVEPEAMDIEKVAEKVRSTDTRMVFVGLGAPKQEYFIETLVNSLKKMEARQPLVLMAVGGSFDFIAGSFKRAPVFIRSIGFEWAWRLVQEPWRWKRQLAIVKFVWLVLKEKYFGLR